MPWRANPLSERRDEPQRKAYCEGFRAGVGMTRKYLAQERPLADLDRLMDTLDVSAEMPDRPDEQHA